MATDNRIHVYLWNCGANNCVGVTIGQDENVSAMGDSPKAVLRQIREWADNSVEKHPWQLNLSLDSPRLTSVTVRVRPEIRLRGKTQPYSEPMVVKLPCVLIAEGPGLLMASFPTLDLEFSITDESELGSMVSHLVSSQLSGKSMAEVFSIIPEGQGTLDVIAVRKSGRSRKRGIPIEGFETGLALRAVCEPLIEKRRGPSVETAAFERDEEVDRLADILLREGSSIILLGESGIGKSTILRQAVRRLPRPLNAADAEEDSSDFPSGDQPLSSRDQFWASSGSRIIAGMKYLGEWEQRCETLISDLNQISGVLCLESLLEIIRIGGQNPDSSVAAFFQPYIQRGDVRLVCEATPQELEQARRLLPGFVSLFQVFTVSELDSTRAIPLISRICESLSGSFQISMEPGVPRQVYHLFRRFQSYAAFPGPAVRFLRSMVQRREIRNHGTLTRSMIHQEFSRLTGLPPSLIQEEVPLRPEEVSDRLREGVIGQDRAVEALTEVVIKLKAGLNDPRRPVGVYLFCGPTGVGKTALAKALAEFLFGHRHEGGRDRSRESLIRLDMSEYSHPGAARRLIEAIDGGASNFIKKVRQNPFSVVLLDEIEKADEEVFDLLLNMLDEGLLTDPLGRAVYFRSSIIILTSNIGATAPAQAGFAASPFPDYEAEVLKFFRPEFFNRLDGVIAFQPLDPSVMERIARLELERLMQRPGLSSRNIRLEFSEKLVREISRSGFDPKFGARPLLRRIEESISVPLSKWLLDQLHLENTVIRMDCDDHGHTSFSLE